MADNLTTTQPDTRSAPKPSPWRRVLLGIYLVSCAMIAAPALFWSVAGDDAYFVLLNPANYSGSAVAAFIDPLRYAFAFEGQPRSTELSLGERQALAVLVMNAAHYFSAPPAIFWALTKILLLLLAFGSIKIFMNSWRVRATSGEVTRIPQQIQSIVLLLSPLLVVLAVKTQTQGFTNGWLYYPSFSILPISTYLLGAAFFLFISRKLSEDYTALRVALLSIVGIFLGITLNLSYELHVLAIPLIALAVLLQPWDQASTRRLRETIRAQLTTLGALTIPFAVIFLWVRFQISQMACLLDGTCYVGSVIQISERAILNSFIAGFPGGVYEWTRAAAESRGMNVLDALPVGLGLFAVATTLVLVLIFSRKLGFGVGWNRTEGGAPAPVDIDTYSLAKLAVFFWVAACGASTITAITELGVLRLSQLAVPYRSGIIMSVCIALAVIFTVLAIVHALPPGRKLVVVAPTAALVVLCVAVGPFAYTHNITAAQLDRQKGLTQTVDQLHWLVVVGGSGAGANERRCFALDQYVAHSGEAGTGRGERTANGANAAFNHYHGTDFCVRPES